ncbi:MAG: TolC family protein [Bacteroidota bacterium]|nr:TolC family protein [Bacteroidota bacterium]
MKIKIVVLAAGLLLTNCLFAQKYLDEYIQIGLTKNLSIQQQNFALEKSVYALKEAKTLFLPRVSFMTDYFRAGGGRTVDFPVGDLLNPVYTTLNQLTGGNNFPQVTNQSILLNPNNFYDARFRTTLPLLNMEIAYNKRIKKDQVSMQQIEIDLFKRELAKEIKLAYYKYLQAAEAIKIYNAALDLVKESSRINSVLHANDKVNNTVIVRAKNEVSKIEAMQKTAVQNAQSAQAYFNFLLNRNLADSILMDYDYNQVAAILSKGAAISGREELKN